MEKDELGSGSSSSNRSYSQVIESVRFYENAILQLQTQLDQAEIMVCVGVSCNMSVVITLFFVHPDE